MKIKGFLEKIKGKEQEMKSNPVIVALTATATKKVRADIIERL
jgi:superfamily II DNA helicase RecQ